MHKIISKNLCYTELVYQRINKKLNLNLSKTEIENLTYDIVNDSGSTINRKGKNYYIKNNQRRVQLTVNAHTFRVITADRI